MNRLRLNTTVDSQGARVDMGWRKRASCFIRIMYGDLCVAIAISIFMGTVYRSREACVALHLTNTIKYGTYNNMYMYMYMYMSMYMSMNVQHC